MTANGLRVAFAQPLYSQVRAQILKRISAGEWGAGEALPNEFALASEYRVSVGTVRRAVEGLEKEGILVRKQGRGTFVAGSGRTPLQDKFTALRRIDGARETIAYRAESVRRRAAEGREVAKLGCVTAASVLEIEQAVTMAGHIVGVERSVVLADLFPRMETQLTYGQHLYPVFNLYGFLVTRASDQIAIVEASTQPVFPLGMPARGPLLQVERVAYSHSDQPVEYRMSHYDPAFVAYATGIV
jgi:GntR family transcriptional regulator